MGKTREEAEKVIEDILHKNPQISLREIPRMQQQLLDGLYGKPESEQLMRMRRVKDALPVEFDGLRINYEAITELIDAEIAREEANG